MPKCDVCNISLGANDMRAHVTGRRHLKKVELLEKLNPQDAPLKTGKTPPAGALQNIVVPALNNIPTAVPVQILKPPAVPAQILKPPAVPAQILKPPAVPVQILKPPTVPVQILKPPAVPVQILKPPTVPVQNNKPLTPAQNDKPSAPVENDKPSTPAQNNKPEMPAANSNAKAKPEKKIPARDKRKRDEKRKGLDPKTSVPPAFVDMNLPFEQQVDHFISQIRQTENEAINIQRVLYDIAQTFAPVMPGVIPILYGSQMTGLAFRTSDIDVYLCNPLALLGDPSFIPNYGRLMYRNRRFQNVVLIARGARVPIVKAQHVETGIEMDISANSSTSCSNSRIIKWILDSDSRIMQLAMLISYWGKKAGLIKLSGFTRYGMILLLIFYLQQLPEPLFPPIKSLVVGVPGKSWPFHIVNKNPPKNNNTLTLSQLFSGFFDFYREFPFNKYIISLYLGKKIPFNEIHSKDYLNLMPHYKFYLAGDGAEGLKVKSPCVQDPFELNMNKAKSVSADVLKMFIRSCTKMSDMMKTAPQSWLSKMIKIEPDQIVKSRSTNLFLPNHNDWLNFRDVLNGALTSLLIKGELISFKELYIEEKSYLADKNNKYLKLTSMTYPPTKTLKTILDQTKKKKLTPEIMTELLKSNKNLNDYKTAKLVNIYLRASLHKIWVKLDLLETIDSESPAKFPKELFRCLEYYFKQTQ